MRFDELIVDSDQIIRDIGEQKFSCIFISHDSSSTGAPIVFKNFIEQSKSTEKLLITFGEIGIFSELTNKLPIICFRKRQMRQASSGYKLAKFLIDELDCLTIDAKVICSSAETINFNYGFSAFSQLDATLLLHEHSTYYNLEYAIGLFSSFQRIVYSSEYVKQSWFKLIQAQLGVGYNINKSICYKIAQPVQIKKYDSDQPNINHKVAENSAITSTLKIAFAGHIQPRKGVHLFLNLCESILNELNSNPENDIKSINVVIVGFPERDNEYSLYIKKRAKELEINFNTQISIINTTPDYLDILKKNDIIVCSSTVDPLPNIVFDSLVLQKPTYVFASSNGHAEYYRSYGLDELIIRIDDLRGSAKQILNSFKSVEITTKANRYLSDLPTKEEYYNKIMNFISTNLDDKHKNIKAFSTNPRWTKLEKFSHSYHLLLSEGVNEQVLATQMLNNLMRWNVEFRWPNDSIARFYLKRILVKAQVIDKQSVQNKEVCILKRKDMSEVISEKHNDNPSYSVHIHSHYHDDAIVILNRIQASGYRPNKFILTTSRPKDLEEKLKCTDLSSIHILECENVGRNFKPLIKAANLINEDFTLHLHTKNSLHNNDVLTKEWVNYLLTSMLGGEGENMNGIYNDIRYNIIQKMAVLDCALAYPLDPYNLEIGANSKQLNKIFPRSKFNNHDRWPYPCGGMFYSSTPFLKDILVPFLETIENDEIKEPLANDATILHGFERSIPLMAYQYADTNMLIIPDNVTR